MHCQDVPVLGGHIILMEHVVILFNYFLNSFEPVIVILFKERLTFASRIVVLHTVAEWHVVQHFVDNIIAVHKLAVGTLDGYRNQSE